MATFPKPLVPVLNVGSFLVEDLVMALPMAENGGAALADISGNGHNAVIAGLENTDYQWVTDPDMGVVLELLSASSWIDLAASLIAVYAAQGAATLQCWIKLDTASPVAGQRGLANFSGLTGANTRTIYPDTTVDQRIQSSVFRGSTRVEDIGLDLGVDRADWHLLTITTQNGGQYLIYQDDILLGGVAAEPLVSVAAPVQFGRSDDTTPASESMRALIGDLRLFSRAISITEIGNVFNNPWGLYTFIQPPGEVERFVVSQDYAPRGGPATLTQQSLLLDAPVVAQGPAGSVELTMLMDVATAGGAYDPPVALPTNLSPYRKPALGGAPAPSLNGDPITTGVLLAVLYNDPAATADPLTEYGPNAHQVAGITWGSGLSASGLPPNDGAFLLSDQANSVFADGDGGTVARAATIEPATDFTLVSMFRLVGTPSSGGVLIGKFANGGGSFAMALRIFPGDTDRIRFEMTDTVDGVATADSPNGQLVANNTYVVVGTYDGAIMRLYVNGAEVSNQVNSGALDHDVTADLGIGQDGAGGTLVGGNVHSEAGFLFDRALTPEEAISLSADVNPFGMFCDSGYVQRFFASHDYAPRGGPASLTNLALMLDLPVVAQAPAGASQVELLLDLAAGVTNTAGLTFFSITPAVGSDQGGQTVVIKGRNFVNITQVLLGGTPLTGLNVIDSGTIEGVTPVHLPGTVDIRIDSTTAGFVEAASVYTFVGGFGPASNQLIIGMQVDPDFFRREVFDGETAPTGVDTLLSLVLDDVPIHPEAVELYVRRLDAGHAAAADDGGLLIRQGAIFGYTVDIANRQITWRGATAPFELLPADELTVVYLARGET